MMEQEAFGTIFILLVNICMGLIGTGVICLGAFWKGLHTQDRGGIGAIGLIVWSVTIVVFLKNGREYGEALFVLMGE